MKLPSLKLQKIESIKTKKIKYSNKINKENFNTLLLSNKNFPSLFVNNNKNPENIEKSYHTIQKYINELYKKKLKLIDKIKTKRSNDKKTITFFRNKSDLSSISKTNINDENEKYTNHNIKKLLCSNKIKKEISSFIFSSPENQ